MLALSWCGTPRAGEPAAAAGNVMHAGNSNHAMNATVDSSRITAITIEEGCTSCDGSVLVLRRDGSASLVITGNARMGTVDRLTHGNLPVGTFDSLTRRVVAEGFYALKDDYQDPSIQDGHWRTMTVSRGADEKKVFSREDSAPANLKRLADAIDEARGGIHFVP